MFGFLAYILFTHPPVTRRHRARVTEAIGLPGDGELRALLLSILQAYVTNGEGELATGSWGNISSPATAASPRATPGSATWRRSRTPISACRRSYIQREPGLTPPFAWNGIAP